MFKERNVVNNVDMSKHIFYSRGVSVLLTFNILIEYMFFYTAIVVSS